MSELANQDHEAEASLECSLPDQHPGPHAALAESSGYNGETRVEHWAPWTLRASEIVILPECTAHGGSPDEPCLLFAEHPGPHTFV